VKFGIGLATIASGSTPDGLALVAETAEELGFESIWSIEHVCMPVSYGSPYPYNPTGKVEAPLDAPIPDPLIPLAYLAARTERLRLATGVMVLPQRHPLQLAKTLATLDRFSRGRAILGIGIGWMREEFDALGLPFERRGARTTETVRAMRSLWKEGPSEFAGEFYRWSKLEQSPKPVRPGGVPIHLGGHTELAARRAARWGDGFMPQLDGPEEMKPLLEIMRAECERVGRSAAELEITAGSSHSLSLAEAKGYEAAGASRVFFVPSSRRAEKVAEALRRFADEVMTEFEVEEPAAPAGS